MMGRSKRTVDERGELTILIDSCFITSIKDAFEKGEAAITDVKGAYLNAKMKDEVIMCITGKEVDLFVELDLSLAQFITYKRGEKVLYTQLNKALYRCVQLALLWYELYSSTPIDMEFEISGMMIGEWEDA